MKAYFSLHSKDLLLGAGLSSISATLLAFAFLREALSPLRVGVDLVEVDAVERSIERFGDRYLRRLFTPEELLHCGGEPARRSQRLAARFAAKEAVIKVLRPADEPLPWSCIEVRSAENGSCDLVLHRQAKSLARAQSLSNWALSMSHEGNLATAVVIAQEGITPRKIRTRKK